MIPFRRGGADDFRAGVAFDDVLDLYVFDRKLRLLVLDALERIEVAVRSALTDHMSQVHGAVWYLDPVHFRDVRRHRDFLKMVRDDCYQQLLAKPEHTDGLWYTSLRWSTTCSRTPARSCRRHGLSWSV